ncbi:hypothetical protein ACJ73_01152 [Blastomyces percursus]|uniref:Importin N-terminal domain-containing protein n=1 Tax=Blastomyces percursus TaxID=1658174 RepID=A0A1J9QF56_9EURO|nr:hypothetical protein ACJ73_01152 [Blastomyces percursus]
MSFSIAELDNTVRAFYEGKGDVQKQAEYALTEFKQNPDAWLVVADILQQSGYVYTKYLGLQVLDDLISTRWNILPVVQRQGIRNFICECIIEHSNTEEKLKNERAFLNKLNLVLVSILKQDWPDNWPNFIKEITEASPANLSVCENNMAIFRLLSEEVFDFSQDQMISEKAKRLKTAMCNEFPLIFNLFSQILADAHQSSLIKATLETLLRFLNWIPLGYAFDQKIISKLLDRFLMVPDFMNLTLKCLTEIGSVQIGQQYLFDETLVQMFTNTMMKVSEMIPSPMDLKQTYATSGSREQEFILNLTLFLCNFFSVHLNLLEKLPDTNILIRAHFYLICISKIEDREIFKICLEYWTKLVQELYEEMQQLPITDINPLVNMGVSGLSNGGAPNPSTLANYPLRKHKYQEVLSELRVVMIEKMVRPEEVLIVENDEGEIVREFVKESDTIQLYKTTRECLVYLTHLDVVDTENIMADKLAKQVDGSEWSWANCNTLCWAIGSISGAMNEETEKRFLVTVIKDLLGLTEMKRGKDNKAVVASNIMYIVGQYPRFLKAHWKFLKTVVNKLFEFMHETHEGVQDMACDTFIKIANKCKRHFVALQPGESEPFIEEIVRTMRKITCDLSPQQIHTFYEACGYMISAQGQKSLQDRLIENLMALPNSAWDAIISQATQNPSILEDPETIKIIGNIMKTNVAACSSIGSFFDSQIGRIYHDMLNMYRATSPLISDAVARGGENATKMPKVRGLRTIKKEILKLIGTYVEKADDLEMVNTNMVPPLLDAVLVDYSNNVPDAREAEVLSVMTTLIHKLHNLMDDKVPLIMECVFACTQAMLDADSRKYPEHYVEHFKLLQAINLYCFPSLIRLSENQFKYVIESIEKATKHDDREVENTALTIFLELVNNMTETDPQISSHFFKQFYMPILQNVFAVLTDSSHKAGFKNQAMLLSRMLYLVKIDKIPGRILPAEETDRSSNRELLAAFLKKNLTFLNLNQTQIDKFVDGLFDFNDDFNKFKTHLRDFLISLKEFAGDNAELYAEEREQALRDAKMAERDRQMKVGGLLKPAEMDQEEEL